MGDARSGMIPRYRLITFSPALSCPVPPHPFRSFIPSGSVTFRPILARPTPHPAPFPSRSVPPHFCPVKGHGVPSRHVHFTPSLCPSVLSVCLTAGRRPFTEYRRVRMLMLMAMTTTRRTPRARRGSGSPNGSGAGRGSLALNGSRRGWGWG